MNPRNGAPGPPCPVCGTPVSAPPGAPCPACGLPAAGQAGMVVGRITATLTELARDRDALLATLRAAAPGRPQAPAEWAPPVPRAEETPLPRPFAPPPSAPPPFAPPPSAPPPFAPPPSAPPPSASGPPPVPPPGPAAVRAPARPRRRVSPEQVLVGLGALLAVAAALVFVARSWSSFGLVAQAAVMVAVTAAACGVSAWAARRGLRATEEALAAAGTALLAVDLGAAHARGLLSLDEVPVRTWSGVSCLVVAGVALGLGRLTRSTMAWPVVALLAVQPVPALLLPGDTLAGPTGVAVALALAAADLGAALALRSALAPAARLLAALWGGLGALAGLLVAWADSPADSWTATALLAAGGVAAVAVLRRTGGPAAPVSVAAGAAVLVAVALTGSLDATGDQGPAAAAALGLVLLTVAVVLAGPRPLAGPVPGAVVPEVRAALLAGGATPAVLGALLLLDADRLRPLTLLALAAAVPATLAAVRVPAVREAATGAALLAPVAAVLLAESDGWLGTPSAGLLLALLGAGSFAAGTWRAGAREEWVCAAAGAAAGVAAGLTTSTVGAWGQVAVQLGIVGVAAGSYAVVACRPPVAVVAVADLVFASWIAVGGAGIQTPEAYTLPAAVGLLVLALPRLRVRGPSWAAEGAAVGVALVPSALTVVSEPTALRLVLVVAAAVVVVVLGTVTHRQAPFVVGAGVLAFVVLGRLGPYAPLLPRWVTLAAAALVLIVLGATYERRRQQAREAVAWVAQMT